MCQRTRGAHADAAREAQRARTTWPRSILVRVAGRVQEGLGDPESEGNDRASRRIVEARKQHFDHLMVGPIVWLWKRVHEREDEAPDLRVCPRQKMQRQSARDDKSCALLSGWLRVLLGGSRARAECGGGGSRTCRMHRCWRRSTVTLEARMKKMNVITNMSAGLHLP